MVQGVWIYIFFITYFSLYLDVYNKLGDMHNKSKLCYLSENLNIIINKLMYLKNIFIMDNCE